MMSMLSRGTPTTRIRRWIVLAGVVGTLCAVSSDSPAVKNTAFTWLFRHGFVVLYDSRGIHALLHFLAFALAGAILFTRRQTNKEATGSLLLLLASAILSEGIETWRYNVSLEWLDILNDFAGAVLAFLFVRRPVTREG